MEPDIQTKETVRNGSHFSTSIIGVANHTTGTKSYALIGLGTLLMLTSVASSGVSIWLLCTIDHASMTFANVSLAGGIMAAILSIVSICAGLCIKERRVALIFSLVLGIISSLYLIAPVMSNITTFAVGYSEQCPCYDDWPRPNYVGSYTGCSQLCSMDRSAIHIGLAVLSGIEGVISMILFVIASLYVCSCCHCCQCPHQLQECGKQSSVNTAEYKQLDLVNSTKSS